MAANSTTPLNSYVARYLQRWRVLPEVDGDKFLTNLTILRRPMTVALMVLAEAPVAISRLCVIRQYMQNAFTAAGDLGPPQRLSNYAKLVERTRLNSNMLSI
jgi:hypothetical protein